jgi:hypothetical protein
VIPIVEGHGDDASIRILLERLWHEIAGGTFIDVLRPIRRPKSKLIQENELRNAIDLAKLKLKQASADGCRELVLVLLDADDDLPCVRGPALKAVAALRPDLDIVVALANVEYETWFVAAAESLAGFMEISAGEVPEHPEQNRCGKAWVEHRFRHHRYSPTQDQPALTRKFELALCRRRSPSFDRLCRELTKRCKKSD